MNLAKFFSRIFTVPHDAPPEVKTAVQPTLDAAHATVTAATAAINPALAELEAGGEALADAYLAKTGVAGAALTPAANVVMGMGAMVLNSVVASKLGAVP